MDEGEDDTKLTGLWVKKGSLTGRDGLCLTEEKEPFHRVFPSFLLPMVSRHVCPLGNGKSILSSLLKVSALSPWGSSPQEAGSLKKGLEADLTADVATRILLPT